jgi:Ca2+-binding RTX toxin-like protein
VGRRTKFLVSVMVGAVLVAIVAGVARAETIQCDGAGDRDPDPGECAGTRRADILNGTDSADRIFGRGGGDRLRGFGEADELYGQSGPDTLVGGPQFDSLIGGPGQDAMRGNGDRDWYFFGEGWGQDSIIDDEASPNELLFRRGPFSNVNVEADLIIDLRPGAGPEVKTTTGTNTINWEGRVITGVSSGTGDDRITGNALGNHLGGLTGADTILGMEGNDDINVQDNAQGGVADDTVNCGEPLFGNADNDFALHDEGDVIHPNCEETSIQP